MVGTWSGSRERARETMERRRFLHAFQRGLFSALEPLRLISRIKGGTKKAALQPLWVSSSRPQDAGRLRVEGRCDCFPGSIIGKMASVKKQSLRANEFLSLPSKARWRFSTLNETLSNLEPPLGWEGAWIQKQVLTMVGSGASGTNAWCTGWLNWK